MIPVPSGVQVWLATGATDMPGLALTVQEALGRNPHAGTCLPSGGGAEIC
ncbi:transposase (plasmid) [Komagataeibacter medellinensis NBRC 3288]|uniref:Transposase n=1 Tax=Komagataeibacter medellinensis (strain NBRC 3288 / BCRC 11682 / LMG 1693 / Kondo 51) TaxID=634177 RepID=G2I7Y7_KOMMN|nr:transposase [Komagataeibacter medellinensis NBRC 3288]